MKFFFCSILMFMAVGIGLWSNRSLFDPVKNIGVISQYEPSDNSQVFDRSGIRIGEIFSRYHVYVPFQEIPRGLIEAIVAIEDKNFFEHPGIDILANLRAAFSYLTKRKISQGASTITQQVVRNFLLSREKTLARKTKEVALALVLENELSKEEIFEIYTNALFLGDGSYGVGAAAKRFFGKGIHELQVHELALIAGLFQSPSRYNPRFRPELAKQRQKQVLRAMYRNRFLSASAYEKAVNAPLRYHSYKYINNETAPYFVDWVKQQAEKILGFGIHNKGLRIYTTLDPALQKIVTDALAASEEQFQNLEKKMRKHGNIDRVEAAAIITSVKTGEILAMIGGRDYNKSQFNRAVDSLRSPGSAFKPAVYSLALKSGRAWSDLVYVAPVTIDTYRPRNNERAFLSETTLLGAFFRSLNTPTVELGTSLGMKKVVHHAKELGISTPLKLESGTILGGSEVTMFDMVRLYGSFASGGYRIEPIGIAKITSRSGKILYEAPSVDSRSNRVVSSQHSRLMTEGLRSVLAYGTGYSQHSLAGKAVGKTGTSNEAKDNWFCGYSSELNTVVWVGTDHQRGLGVQASANRLALPIWGRILNHSELHYPSQSVEEPSEGVVMYKVDPRFGNLSQMGIPMFFLAGTEPLIDYSDLELVQGKKSFRQIFE